MIVLNCVVKCCADAFNYPLQVDFRLLLMCHFNKTLLLSFRVIDNVNESALKRIVDNLSVLRILRQDLIDDGDLSGLQRDDADGRERH